MPHPVEADETAYPIDISTLCPYAVVPQANGMPNLIHQPGRAGSTGTGRVHIVGNLILYGHTVYMPQPMESQGESPVTFSCLMDTSARLIAACVVYF
jgi:hypothetical protein